MAIRVNHCIVFKFESINDICSALININDVVCCSLDIGVFFVYSLCSLLTYSLYFISLIKLLCYKCFNYMSNKIIPYHTMISYHSLDISPI